MHLITGTVAVVAKLPASVQLGAGDQRTFSVARDKLYLFDAESGESLGTVA